MSDASNNLVPSLIPLELLFGNPDRAMPRLSPDGTQLAFLAPDDGVLNVWLGPAGEDHFEPVTNDRDRGIRTYFWGHDGESILYLQDTGGDTGLGAVFRELAPKLRRRSMVILLSDCFGAPHDAAEIVSATHNYLSAQNVDLVFSNQSHPEWIRGFRNNGYVTLANRRVFAISPPFSEKLAPFSKTIANLHLTNMDGHGPHGFQD